MTDLLCSETVLIVQKKNNILYIEETAIILMCTVAANYGVVTTVHIFILTFYSFERMLLNNSFAEKITHGPLTFIYFLLFACKKIKNKKIKKRC